jgi:Tfp pilus assembly protein PilV
MNEVIDMLRMIRGQRGFTVTETVIAIGFLAMSLVALLAGIGQGTSSVDSARRGTTALFLAEQQMEAAKAFALGDATAGQGWPNLTTAAFPAEGYNAIAVYPDYRRTLTVTSSPGGLLNMKQVEVQVFYRPVGAAAETSVAVATLVVDR